MEINVDVDGIRLDSFLIDKIAKSRSKIQSMIKDGDILVNGKSSKSSYVVKVNDVISITFKEEEVMDAKAEKMDLDIVYEDSDVIVVNKKNGVVVHPAVGNTSGTLVNGLLYHSDKLSGVNGSFRPGIVHRIDAFTTGLLMVAKNDYAHEFLAKQLEEKSTHRKYYALVWGVIPNDTGTIDAPIGRNVNDRKKMEVTSKNSKEAITNFKVLERFKNVTLLELKLETGRTHQIRVHLKYINHPVCNDPVYSNNKNIDNYGQLLHAKEISFIHPRTKKEMTFSCEPDEEFNKLLKIYEDK